MTLEEAGIDPEQLLHVRDRPLETAYEVHDVGQAILIARLEAHGFHVREHGDDARHADEVYYGDGPDLAIYGTDPEACEAVDEDLLLCYVEIKCKEDPVWFGRCNLRHYNEYVNHNNEVDVPVWLWFAYVQRETGMVHREAFVEVEDTDQIGGEVIDVEDTLVFDERDVYDLDLDDDSLVAVDGSDVIGVQRADTIVDFIPNVHGNDVIELNDDAFRSWSHFCWTLDAPVA